MIYHVSMSIDTIYSINNRLTKYQQKIKNIGDISVWGDMSPIISNFYRYLLKTFKKKKTIFVVGVSLWSKEIGYEEM